MTTTATRGSLQLLQPEDEGYEQSRRTWNGAIDRHPAFIARCRTTADVVEGVRLATEHGLVLAVRGGGHSIPGYSTCDGGLVLDLTLMKDVHVDAAAGLAHVGPGVLWRELDAATSAHGLATTGGEISDTGVAGLTLGGGIGWLSRRNGHACDQLVGARLVLASGEVVEVDAEREPDLLWGLRGGGGNFGVVTEFRTRLHPTPDPWVVQQLHAADDAAVALRAWRDLAQEAPDDLSTTAVLLTAPPAPHVPEALHGRPVLALATAWWGDPADGERLVARLRPAQVEARGPMPYPALQSAFDASAPWGFPAHCKSDFLGRLDDAALDALVDTAWASPSPLSHVLLRRLGGAASAVPREATAFAHRDAEHLLTVAGIWPPGTDGSAEPDWCRTTWSALRPWATGTYANHLDVDEGGDARVAEAYPRATYDRLARLKARVDPDNVFRLNVNVAPARS